MKMLRKIMKLPLLNSSIEHSTLNCSHLCKKKSLNIYIYKTLYTHNLFYNNWIFNVETCISVCAAFQELTCVFYSRLLSGSRGINTLIQPAPDVLPQLPLSLSLILDFFWALYFQVRLAAAHKTQGAWLDPNLGGGEVYVWWEELDLDPTTPPVFTAHVWHERFTASGSLGYRLSIKRVGVPLTNIFLTH